MRSLGSFNLVLELSPLLDLSPFAVLFLSMKEKWRDIPGVGLNGDRTRYVDDGNNLVHLSLKGLMHTIIGFYIKSSATIRQLSDLKGLTNV